MLKQRNKSIKPRERQKEENKLVKNENRRRNDLLSYEPILKKTYDIFAGEKFVSPEDHEECEVDGSGNQGEKHPELYRRFVVFDNLLLAFGCLFAFGGL